MQLWLQQRQQKQLKPSQLKMFFRQLRDDTTLAPVEIQEKLEAFMVGHQVDMQLVQDITAQATEEAKAWRAKRQEQYQERLQAACEGGMRGLYRALKSPENNQARPYREQSGELRPHLRRMEWKAVWQPLPGNKQLADPLFDQLYASAQAQLKEVGPLTDKPSCQSPQENG